MRPGSTCRSEYYRPTVNLFANICVCRALDTLEIKSSWPTGADPSSSINETDARQRRDLVYAFERTYNRKTKKKKKKIYIETLSVTSRFYDDVFFFFSVSRNAPRFVRKGDTGQRRHLISSSFFFSGISLFFLFTNRKR